MGKTAAKRWLAKKNIRNMAVKGLQKHDRKKVLWENGFRKEAAETMQKHDCQKMVAEKIAARK